jgi:YegS/Rv2252/BmrU family lipid kinase
MRAAVIVNPVSGAHGRPDAGRRRAELASAVLGRAGVAAEIHVTDAPGHAFDLARTAVGRGASVVFAWGGDGTVNEVGRALAFGPAALAVVPAGSGNGLARELGVPRDPAAALRAGLAAGERLIDAGELGERLFFNVAGIGFDAHVAARFNARTRRRRGPLPYFLIGIGEIFWYRPAEYRLSVDGETWSCRALLLVCANSRRYGGEVLIAPRARLDDGCLDLVTVAPRGPLRALWDARHIFTGSIGQARGVAMRSFTRLEVSATGPLPFHVDGEPAHGGPILAARVHPRALRVRAGSPADA